MNKKLLEKENSNYLKVIINNNNNKIIIIINKFKEVEKISQFCLC